MPDPNQNSGDPNANQNPSGGDWRTTFGADATQALSGFKEPGDFFKQFQTVSTELDGLKKSPPTFDWRKEMAGDDADFAKQLERFSTGKDFSKAFREAQTKIRSGELGKPLPKDATPEQIAEWREGNGVPEKPDGYFSSMPNGLVIGADDKPMFDAVAAKFHEHNVRPEVMHAVAQWYYGMQDEQVEAQKVADVEGKNKLAGALRTAWGNDFTSNSNVYASYIDSAPKEVKELLTQARGPDGNFVLYNPAIVSWLTAQAREINPAGHLVPNTGAGDMQSLQTEIDSIEKLMRTDRQAYNKDTAKQDRLRQLYTARTKLQERGRAA